MTALLSQVLAAPMDRFGRPLADESGELSYFVRPDGWWVRSVDGVRLAEGPDLPLPSSAGPPPSSPGFMLHGLSNVQIEGWATAVAIGDVTGDNRADVLLTTTCDNCQVFVFAQDDHGGLKAPIGYPYGSPAGRTGLVLADMDEDGVRDVVVGHSSGVSVLLADGEGGLLPAQIFVDADADTLATTDVNLDGHLDLVSLGWSRGASVLYGDGHGGFEAIEALPTQALGYNDHEIEDLTGDGYSDLAVMSGQYYDVPNLSLHMHDGEGALSDSPLTWNLEKQENTSGIGLGDLNGDGLHDVVLSSGGNIQPLLYMLLQQPGGGFGKAETVSTYDIPEPVEVVDIDGNGYEDVLVAHGGWSTLSVYLHDAQGLASETRYDLFHASHYAPQGLAVGDVSGDGCADVAVADYMAGLVLLWGMGCGEVDDESDDTSDNQDNGEGGFGRVPGEDGHGCGCASPPIIPCFPAAGLLLVMTLRRRGCTRVVE